ncbi:hypothetical protein [Paraburkholderia ferrariae]|uniref:Uncharacterized protein n=1 Tax=Paraburkholderia ferrariae TaxID=386056 RepID=A0ABU9RZJ0_9BURK
MSTDEITPMSVLTRFDDRLGRVPYLGFQTGEHNPVGMDSVLNGGFSVTVAGNRYGKGSPKQLMLAFALNKSRLVRLIEHRYPLLVNERITLAATDL